MPRRHRVRSSGTSIKTYVLLTVIAGVAVLVMQGFIMLTKSAKEGIEEAASGMVNAAVQAEIQKAAGNQVSARR